ncbi:YlzJ-like family protein [Niallia sp. NCCP-28]|uniref:YlzJ-like family protein n=1 Tax=Niallia sp. NCCP-28 TaxID=2934712 RepID=UPI0020832AD9|nr:YlzJ-like family protein [Niallia sp. NCCP-28]GKU82533.1 ribonuclease [Niallia sp. NCCP-28]
MIMYTMMPEELIFPIHQDIYEKQRVINYNGIPLLVELNQPHQYEVIRILSTDPNHYLHSPIQPGTKLNVNESFIF